MYLLFEFCGVNHTVLGLSRHSVPCGALAISQVDGLSAHRADGFAVTNLKVLMLTAHL